jgi:dsDNA-specific endonuclease/ATPase MutS2
MPNDLFEFIPSADETLPKDHALWGLRKDEAIEEVNKMLNELPMEKIEQLYQILKSGELK